MNKLIVLLFSVFLITGILTGQEIDFETRIRDSIRDDRLSDVIEANGYYFCSTISMVTNEAVISKINKTNIGAGFEWFYINKLIFSISDDSILIALCTYVEDNQGYVSIARFTTDLEYIDENIYYNGTETRLSSRSSNIFINSQNQIICAGHGENNSYRNSVFYKFNLQGDSLLFRIFTEGISSPVNYITCLIEAPDHEGYIALARNLVEGTYLNTGILELDTAFNIGQGYQFSGLIYEDFSDFISIGESGFVMSGTDDWYINAVSTVKMDQNYEYISDNSFGLFTGEKYHSALSNNLSKLNDTTFYYGGMTNYQGGAFYPSADNMIMINFLDDSLNLLWDFYHGGDAYYDINVIRATSDGGCIVGGVYYNESFMNHERDTYILKISPPQDTTGIHAECTEDLIEVFPNPGHSEIYINNPNGRAKHFYLFSATGKKLNSRKLKPGINRMNTEKLTPGIYIWKIKDDQKIMKTGKWIKN